MKYPWTKKEANLLPETPKPRVAKALIASTESSGTTPSTSFSNQSEVFEKCPIIREMVVHSAMEIVGNGFFTTSQGDLTLKLSIDGKGSFDAKGAVDYWNEMNDTDEKMLTAAIELVAYGNSIFYKTDNGLKSLDIKCLLRVVPSEKNVPISEKFDLQLCGKYAGKTLVWGEFVLFRANVTSSSFPLGTGVIKALMETYGDNEFSKLDIYYALENATLKGFRRFGQPVEFIHPDTPDADMTSVNEEIKKLRDGGGRITVNLPVSVTSNMPAKTEGYDAWLKDEADSFIMCLGDPSLKASVESGFTEASIRGSIELFRKKVNSFRRIIKRGFEQVWKQVLVNYGFDGDKSQIRLEFGADETAWTPADLLNAANNNMISPEEYRVIAKEKFHWKLEDKAPPKQESPPVDEKVDQ